MIELLENNNKLFEVERFKFEKINHLKYLRTTTVKGNWNKEVIIVNTKQKKAYYALMKFYKSKLFSRKTKLQLYMVIIKSMLMHR